MCGIAGLWRQGGASADRLETEAGSMIDRLQHRGPDDRGVWSDPEAGLALANRRLAVVDLSPGGHQPMLSADGRIAVAFNGEIYNHRALRHDLETVGVRFRSVSDTEVLVEAIARWGLDTALARVNGQFALAIWFRAERTLVLVRDRFGEKPLYWSLEGGLLLFGSELKAMRAHPDFPTDLSATGLAAYFRHGFLPAPLTIHHAVHQVSPGCMVRIAGGTASTVRFWSPASLAMAGQADPMPADPDLVVAAIESLLARSVALRRIADVPLGLFLSGGIDSSLVAALAQAQSGRPLKTFSIGFTERDHDESSAAAAVAAHLGTDHTGFLVTPADAMATIPTLATIYDEPFADSSQIPTVLLARLARRDVTVALTGDGGDELFAGYSRHVWAHRLARVRALLPGPLRRLAAASLTSIPPALWDRLADGHGAAPRFGERVHKGAAVLAGADGTDALAAAAHRWPNPAEILQIPPKAGSTFPAHDAESRPEHPVAAMQLADLETYLGSGVLTKVDRATMSASLEARAPFLDPDLLAAAWRLPPVLRVRDGRGKWLLRHMLARHLPAGIVQRPKSGFTVPIGVWLRGPLRGWAEDLMAGSSLTDAGLQPLPVRRAWQRHLSGIGNETDRVWSVLIYLSWLRDGRTL